MSDSTADTRLAAGPSPAGAGPTAGAAPGPHSGRDRDWADWTRRNGVYVALLALVVLNIAITDNFLTETVLRLQLIQVAPVVIVALGMALVIGTEGIDLSVGAVMALTAAIIPMYIGYGAPVAIVVGLLAGVVTGLLAGVLVAKVGVQPIVATLGIMVAGRGVANLVGGEIKTIRDEGIVNLGSGNIAQVPYTVVVAAVLAVVVAFVVRRTTYGRQLIAVGGNKRASLLAGIPVTRILMVTYVISGVLAAVAGVLLAARSQASDPVKFGLLMELSAITAVVVGGTPLSGGQVRILGTVAGALVMQLVTATLIFHDISDSAAQMIQAGIVIAAVYIQVGRRRGGSA